MKLQRTWIGVLLQLFSIATMAYGELSYYVDGIDAFFSMAWAIGVVGLLVGFSGTIETE
jgi:hypothetical protein